MKAVKLTKIVWNLDSVNKENREEVLNTLPKYKGFMAADDFNVVEKVPAILKKKFGYEVITFSYVELRVVDNVEDLLLLCTPKGEKPKKLFLKSGELSSFGEEMVNALESNITRRLKLEFRGTHIDEMPSLLDEIQIGVEKVTGMNWEGHSVEELMSPIMNKIRYAKAVNLIDKYEDISKDDEDYDEEED